MMSAQQNERITRIGPGHAAENCCGNTGSRRRSPKESTAGAAGGAGAAARRGPRAVSRQDKGRYGLIGRRLSASRHRSRLWALRGRRAALRLSRLAVRHHRAMPRRRRPSRRVAHAHADPPQEAIRRWSATASCSLHGQGEPPPALPDFDCFVAPDRYTFAFKGLWECNWLQARKSGSIHRTPRSCIAISRMRTSKIPMAGSSVTHRPTATCREQGAA